MGDGVKKQIQDVEKGVQSALLKHPEVFVEIEEGSPLYRAQATRHKNPIFYNKREDSDSRYRDSTREIGVAYVATIPEVAIAETFQHGVGGPGAPVLMSDIQDTSVYQMAAARKLRLVDVGMANAFIGGRKLRDLVEAKGQGSDGYVLTQALSSAIMRYSEEIDGLLYNSHVFPAAANDGWNIVLFERETAQLVPVSSKPLTEVELANGQTAIEFLLDLNVTVE